MVQKHAVRKASATAAVVPALSKKAVAPYESASATPMSKIDEIVFGRLHAAGITPANPCSDEVFVRRAYLDVIGTLPTPAEVRTFLQNSKPTRRHDLIETLLDRDEYADYWSMKWCDLLRVKAEFPINLWPNAVQTYHRWIRDSIRDNKPYDRFVREMLVSSGSNFKDSPVNFYRAMQAKQPEVVARMAALTFMGTRAEKWPKARLAGLAAFFTQMDYKHTLEWKEEIVIFNPDHAMVGKPVFPDGKPAHIAPGQDPRVVFTNWLLTPGNPWFARNIANRVWCWLFGTGIINEPDDIRPDNPPSIPDLLVNLERELIVSKYDLKHLYRLILNSRTYQLSSIPADPKKPGDKLFAHYPIRRVEAEPLIDALNQITGTTESYSSAAPEPFTFIPEDQRSIALADGSISSSFLELFGRPARDTGLESERNNRTTTEQRMHMLNSSHIQRKIERGSVLAVLLNSGKTKPQMVEELYLLILSRFPTDDEQKTAEAYSRTSASTPRNLLSDLAWALINSAEFLYRH